MLLLRRAAPASVPAASPSCICPLTLPTHPITCAGMQIAAAIVSVAVENNGDRGWLSFTLLVCSCIFHCCFARFVTLGMLAAAPGGRRRPLLRDASPRPSCLLRLPRRPRLPLASTSATSQII